MDLSEFPYKTSMACESVATLSREHPLISSASVENLKKIVPSFGLKDEYDLLAIAFNSCVVNMANQNGDLIDTSSALQIYRNFAHRPINIEHDRSKCVGHLVGSALSSFDIDYSKGSGSELLSEEQVLAKLDPFNVSLSGFIYKLVDPDLVDLIVQASNPLSDNYLKISASWELAFTSYDILFGSPLMSKGEVITDPQRKAELSSYIKAFGGSGKYKDGQDVFRILRGNIIPVGIGLTTTPAAAVQGVIPVISSSEANSEEINTNEQNVIENENNELEQQVASISKENQEENQTNKNIISQLENDIVNLHSIMTLKDINDENLKTLSVATLQEIVKEETQASRNQALSDAIEKASTEYGAQLDEQKKIAEEKTLEVDSVKATLDQMNKQLEKVQQELETERQARASELAVSKAASRLTELSNAYNLNDKDRQIIEKQIRGLDDESYASWLADWSIIAETKSKTYKPEEVIASAGEVLDGLKPSKTSMPNAQDLSSQKATWDNAFKLEDLVPSSAKQ